MNSLAFLHYPQGGSVNGEGDKLIIAASLLQGIAVLEQDPVEIAETYVVDIDTVIAGAAAGSSGILAAYNPAQTVSPSWGTLTVASEGTLVAVSAESLELVIDPDTDTLDVAPETNEVEA